MEKTLRICLWSGPRNVSTALMYSFGQRPDTRVVDEPLYAHYLRVTGAEHPGREEVLASQENDGEKVIRDVVLAPCDRPVFFMKQMAHHLVGLNQDFLRQTANVLLIREPADMLISLRRQLPNPCLEDTGLAVASQLLTDLRALGQDPPVLDAQQLLLDPEAVLRQLCDRLGLPFDSRMLRWAAGSRAEDGVWARLWYHNIHRSTGFDPYRPKPGPFPADLVPVLEQCRPHYDALFAQALRAPSSPEPNAAP